MNALLIAVNMEMEGKEFYQKASQKASNVLGKALFERLAKEEDFHAAKAGEIYDALNLGEKPIAIEESLDQGVHLKSIFAKAVKDLNAQREVSSDEFEIIDMAMDLEQKSIQFYIEHAEMSGNEFEQRYFTALQAEERGHYLSLIDYKQYLTAPEDWFAEVEHHSLDGA